MYCVFEAVAMWSPKPTNQPTNKQTSVIILKKFNNILFTYVKYLPY